MNPADIPSESAAQRMANLSGGEAILGPFRPGEYLRGIHLNTKCTAGDAIANPMLVVIAVSPLPDSDYSAMQPLTPQGGLQLFFNRLCSDSVGTTGFIYDGIIPLNLRITHHRQYIRIRISQNLGATSTSFIGCVIPVADPEQNLAAQLEPK